MSAQPEHEWTIMSAQWHFLKARFAGGAGDIAQLVPFVAKEAKRQDEFEKQGMRSVSWRLLKSIQAATGAEVLIGGTAVASPPFFRSMGRGNCAFWGELEGPAIVLWDHMDDQERDQCRQTFAKQNDWVILCNQDQQASSHQRLTRPPNHLILATPNFSMASFHASSCIHFVPATIGTSFVPATIGTTIGIN